MMGSHVILKLAQKAGSVQRAGSAPCAPPPCHLGGGHGRSSPLPAAGVPSLTPNEVHTASSPSQSFEEPTWRWLSSSISLTTLQESAPNQPCATDGETEAQVSHSQEVTAVESWWSWESNTPGCYSSSAPDRPCGLGPCPNLHKWMVIHRSGCRRHRWLCKHPVQCRTRQEEKNNKHLLSADASEHIT